MLTKSGGLAICLLIGTFMLTNNKNPEMSIPFDQPPKWAQEAIWYQIFVERFRNGNIQNDPTRLTCDNALIDKLPDDWKLTPWGHNWYKQEKWAKATGLDFYRTIQMRRYGGDLAGVEEKIPYLIELGINAIYFNPINDAPSLHKYDARYYHHIDVTFGDDILGDMKMIAKENHADPKSWVWTSADKKFLSLIKKLHDAGIRVIMDYSWNHTGNNFWAFKDVEKHPESSPYKDWYNFRLVKDSEANTTEYEYEGWLGIKNLPELKKIDTNGKIPGHPYEGNIHPSVKEHIFAVCRRWMDPNNDGNTNDGIDGMRLDVAEHVPLGFWRDFRKFVRSVNPEFYLVGENWWTQWPDEMMDPGPWVKGDIFDAVMHYQWYKVARGYFAQPEDKVDIQQFKSGMDSLFQKFPEYTKRSMMNLISSHDSPRFIQSFLNLNKYKFNCKPQEDSSYKTYSPDGVTLHKAKLLLLHQFTFVGSPHIWNGDEMGMTGADDPDNRKPLTWPDINFEPETQSDFSDYTYSEQPVFNASVFQFYQSIIKLRCSSKAFSNGNYEFENISDENNILAYYRSSDDEKFLIIFNNNENKTSIRLPINIVGYEVVFAYRFIKKESGKLIDFPPYSAVVFKITE